MCRKLPGHLISELSGCLFQLQWRISLEFNILMYINAHGGSEHLNDGKLLVSTRVSLAALLISSTGGSARPKQQNAPTCKNMMILNSLGLISSSTAGIATANSI